MIKKKKFTYNINYMYISGIFRIFFLWGSDICHYKGQIKFIRKEKKRIDYSNIQLEGLSLIYLKINFRVIFTISSVHTISIT